MSKIIMIILTAFMLTFLAISTADAAKVSVGGLTEEQAATLQLQAARYKQAGGPSTPAEVKEWASIGASVGKALAETAKQLGQEVNTFANTSVGKIALFLIVWYMFGSMIVHVLFGVLFFVVGVIIWLKLFRRVCLYKNERVISKLGFKIRDIKYFDLGAMTDYDLSGLHSTRLWFLLVMILLIGVSMITIFTW